MARGHVRADGTVPTAAERGRARAVNNRLAARYPDTGTALRYDDPWQLVVATVLSAQTTDDNVNRVTPRLFEAYPSPEDLAGADPETVEQIVFPTGFYRQKTRSVMTLSADLAERYGGEVPDDLDELTTLRGVGRKTASVVLSEAFGQPAIAVDTHVKRVSRRLELTTETDPIRIEADLKALFPKQTWQKLSMRMIQFGRDICVARKPRCWECPLEDLCPYPDKPPVLA